MADFKTRFSKQSFIDYLKLGIALQITKTGLQNVVKEEEEEIYRNTLNDLAGMQLCSSYHRYRPCRDCIRNGIRERIQAKHRGNPAWRYTDVEQLSTDPFQISKCPDQGYANVNTIEAVDLNGLLHLILNNKHFVKMENVCVKAINVVQTYRDSDTLAIARKELHNYISVLIELMSEVEILLFDTRTTESTTKLKQLKENTLTLDNLLVKDVLADIAVSIGSRRKIHKTSAQNEKNGSWKPREMDTKLKILTDCQGLLSNKTSQIKCSHLEEVLCEQTLAFKELIKPRTGSKLVQLSEKRKAVTFEKREQCKRPRTVFEKPSTSHISGDLPTDYEGYSLQQHEFDPNTLSQEPFVNKRSAQELAVSFIRSGDIPDKDTLNKLCKTLGRRDENFVKVCEAICQRIKKSNTKIASVCPTYRSATSCTSIENEIVFVAYARETIKNPKKFKDLGYTVKLREKDKYSEEGRDVFYSESFSKYSLSTGESNRLKSCINKHAADLMERHSYLSVIAPSPVRSKGYVSSNDFIVKREPCIALYVHTKGYIPITEDPFQNEYDGIPVDVREGSFETHHRSQNSKKYHNTLQIGSEIGNKAGIGTLGGFIEHPFYGLCGFTCAHVLVKDTETLKSRGTIEWPSFESMEKEYQEVYQPGNSNEDIGSLVLARYEEGCGDSSGVEVALFQIECRHPVAGDFPKTKRNAMHYDLRFDSGKVQGFSRKVKAPVVKFGSASFKTEGEIDFTMPPTIFTGEVTGLSLSNQLEVKPIKKKGEKERQPFSKPGDSGSLVFMKGNDGKLACVGMVEGGTSYGSSIITPITSVLKAFNVSKLKSFETERLASKLSTVKTDISMMRTDITNLRETCRRKIRTGLEERK